MYHVKNIFVYLFDDLLHHVVIQEDALGRHDDAVQSYKYHQSIPHEKLD